MAGLGKKILSAFVEVNPPDAQPAASDKNKMGPPTQGDTTPAVSGHNGQWFGAPHTAPSGSQQAHTTDSRMLEYFDKLYSDAFAGLQAQGLTMEKLLSTAEEYLKVLDTDAAHFHSTVEAALQEKVQDKKTEVE